MVRLAETYSYKGASEILRRKSLSREIEYAITDAPIVEHPVLQGLLGQRGWQVKAYLLEGTRYMQDAFKDRVLVEIDLKGSLLDSVHRNFLRAQLLMVLGKIDVLVQIVETQRDPKFQSIKRDVEMFSPVITVPILLLGVEQ